MTFEFDKEALQEGGRAFVLHPALADDQDARTLTAQLEEAIGLARAINLTVVEADSFIVQRPRPATLIGAGKTSAVAAALDAVDPRPQLVVVNRSLSPVQHRNLEKAWGAKVLDRTALILEIFGARAQTAEGRLQVDLAHLTFQRSRLVRSWTHLERQRGGAGFLGGPGERQIEADRRALATRIDRLKEKLEQVRRTRRLQRAKRKRAPHPVVALVGYTNAGKSTLFNRLTGAEIFAQDLLFATLDPTMRAVDLPTGERIILSDTVGFISDLPTQLVAAFRATLEEVLEAEIIVHVRDCAHEDTEAQRHDVIEVLAALGITAADERPFIEVLNKIDLLDADDRMTMRASTALSVESAEMTVDDPLRVALSAETGEGVDRLCKFIDNLVTADRPTMRFFFAPTCDDVSAARAWLYARADVQEEEITVDGAVFQVRLSAKTAGQFVKSFPSAERLTDIENTKEKRA